MNFNKHMTKIFIVTMIFTLSLSNNISYAAKVNKTIKSSGSENSESDSSGQCFSHPAMKEVKSVVDQILVDLRAKKDSIKDHKVIYGIINERLVPKADFNVMSRLVLTNRWKKLNSEQQEKFVKEFGRLMIRTYGVAFEAYDGETVDFHCPIRELSGNSDRIELSSTIRHNKQPDNAVKFRVLKINQTCQACNFCTDKTTNCKTECDQCKTCQSSKSDTGCSLKWQVYDLIIDNVSIIDSYRQVFSDKFRKDSNANKIIADMHEKNCKEKMFCD